MVERPVSKPNDRIKGVFGPGATFMFEYIDGILAPKVERKAIIKIKDKKR